MGKTAISLSGKTALVTGASSGIGKAIAFRLAQSGVNIILVGKTRSKLASCEKEIVRLGVKAFTYNLDLANEDEITYVFEKIRTNHKDIDILVHSAGVIRQSTITNAAISDFDYQMAVNLKAPVVITKLLQAVLVNARGQIVYINSSVVNNPKPETSYYGASKAGLKAFADGLRTEVNQYGVRVMSIFPGSTASELQANLYKELNKTYEPGKLLQPVDIAEITVSTLQLPLTAEVTDVFVRPFQK